MRRLHALKRFIMMSLFAIMIIGAFATAHAATATAPSLVVKMADGLTADQQAAVVGRNGGVETAAIPVLRMHVISIPTGDPALVLRNYQSDPQVERAELNKTRKTEGLPSDAHYSVQWALSKIGWDSVFGSLVPTGSAKVAILDTGIDASHPDLHANVIDGTSMLDNSSGSSDANGHGTSLAGIVAAVTNNDLGIAGLGFSGVQIMPVTVLNASGIGQDSDIIAGVIWAADHGADVILMGFSNADFSQNLQDSIDYAWAKGAVLVAATGNDGLSTPTFPAGARGVVGVSATNEDDALAFGSNYGQDTFLAAPGTNVYTTVPGGSYNYITGTSASSAMVAGAAALLKAMDPALTNGVIVGRLAKSAAAVGTAGDPANQSYFGNGRLDLAAAVASTSTESVQPAGAAPVGSGGPYVGPYVAAGNTGVYGTVTTLVNGQSVGIDQATVTCTAGCNGTFTATTGSNGIYTFATDPTYRSNNSDVTFTATAGGYIDRSVTVTLHNGKTDAAVNFVLVAQPKSSASVELTNLSQTYDGSPKVVNAATSPAGLNLEITYNGSTTAPTDAGSYTVVATINDPKYAGSATGTLTVAKARATVTLAPLTQAYDGSARTVTATTDPAGKAVSITYDGASAAPVNAGSYAVAAAINDTNYEGSATGTLTVAKARASVTLAPLTQTYDGSARTVTATTDPAGKAVSISYDGVSAAPVNAGSYAVAATINDTNYEGSATGTLTVAKVRATVTLAPLTQTYDGFARTVTATTDPAGKAVAITYDGASAAPVNAGSYAVAATINDSNYEGSATGTLTVAKARATVTLAPLTQTYDGSARTVAATTDPLGKAVSISYDGASAAPVNAGSYAIAATINDTNYEGSATVTLTVAKARATVTLAPLSQIYDGSARAVTATTDPPGKTVSITYDGASAAPVNAGSYAVTATVNDTNYEGSATGILTVAKARATVTLAPLSQIYDGSARIVTATTDPAGKAVSISYDGASAAPISAGSYAVAATINDTNYEGSASGTLTVAKAAATVTLTGLSQTYDGSARTVTATTHAPVKAVTVTYNGATSAPTGAGSYAIVATVDDPNYEGSATGTLSVAKADATVTLAALTQTYDGSPRTVTATTDVPVQGVTITYNGAAAAPTGAGEYPIAATVNDPNYQGSAVGTLLVAKASATITLLGLTQTYDGSARIVSASTNPAGKLVAVSYDGGSTAPTGAGTYAISATIDDPNYQGNSSGTLTVAKGAATVTLSGLSQTYDGSARAVTATTNPAVNTVTITYDGAASAPTGAGRYAVVALVSDQNYEGSATGTLTVAKAAATVTLTGLSQSCDGSARTVTATTEPAGKAVSITYDGASTAPINAGSYAIAAAVNDANYEGSATGTLTVAKAAGTVTLSALSQTYNGSPRIVTATTNPPGSKVDITYDGSTTAPTNAGSYSVVAVINDTNSEGSMSGTLTVAKASATVTLTGLSQTYSGYPKTVTATTNPRGKTVEITYNNSPAAPTGVGSYAVVATISDTNYEGSATGTMNLAKGTATVTLSGLSQPYDGSPKSVSATTNPPGLQVDITYNGSPTAPANFGSYPVLAVISDTNYQGKASATLNILTALPAPSSINVPATNNSGTITVSWTGTGDPGLSYVLEYSTDTDPTWRKVYSGIYGFASMSVTNGKYSFRVKETRSGYADSPYLVSTKCEVFLACDPPTYVNAPAGSSTGSVTVAWGGGNVSGLTYSVEYSIAGSNNWVPAYTGIYGYVTLNLPNGNYLFRVRNAKEGYRTSDYTVSSSCQVLRACDPPTYVNAPASSSTGSVTVTWGGGNVPGLTYSLEYSIAGSNDWVPAYTGIYGFVTLNLPNGNYLFRVRSAKDGYRTSDYTLSSSCEVLLACGPPTQVTVPATSTRNVSVSWTGGTVSGATYKVQYRNGTGIWTDAYSGIYNYAVVTVPTSGSYTFRVQATKQPTYQDSPWTESSSVLVSP